MVIDLEGRWPTAANPQSSGRIRVAIDDFIVREQRETVFDETGEHLYLLVERAGATTPHVRRQLASLFGVTPTDVGYAGMKDKKALVTQWFSIRLPRRPDALPRDRSLRILERHWHGKKLKIGALDGNTFEIVVRAATDARTLRQVASNEATFPNYFGVQRFGADGGNIAAASDWLRARETRAGRRRIPAFRRSIYLSALRSLLFNDVLARRVRTDQWREAIDGDVCIDGYPSGPLWGRGRSAAQGAAHALEAAVVREHEPIAHGLEYAGVVQDRRSFVATAEHLVAEHHRDRLWLSFTLGKGQYATSFLNELVILQ